MYVTKLDHAVCVKCVQISMFWNVQLSFMNAEHAYLSFCIKNWENYGIFFLVLIF